MLFTEPTFFFFFALVFPLYWMLPGNKSRKLWLLIASYVFYGAWDWRFLGLILASTVIDFFTALQMEKRSHFVARRMLLSFSLCANLGILGFFKYWNFFATSAASALTYFGIEHAERTLEIVLPVGISFFTFQTMSYSIDVYRKKLRANRSFVDFSLFVAFFPQLVAGPIVRATDFLPQLENKRRFADIAFRPLLTLFLLGFFKKACIADHLAPIVDEVYGNPSIYSSQAIWIATLFYAAQIYCDFSGYTDMAIAIGGVLGYDLGKNFLHPYFATNITEFWRRWHISLSTWLRDYLYIPLGGNRGSLLFTYRNISLTMLLGGLWHGASWNFVIWGGLHGCALILHKEYSRRGLGDRFAGVMSILGVVFTFYWVCLTWIFFRATDLGSALAMARAFVLLDSSGTEALPFAYVSAFLLMAIAHGVAYHKSLGHQIERLPDWTFAIGYGAAVTTVLPFVQLEYQPFIYFQF